MTIFELMLSLKRAKPDVEVRFDFGGCVPTTIASSRGNYAIPALGWSPRGYSDSAKAPTVATLLAELENATDGRQYGGWKGGKYTYKPNHRICVDNPGYWTSTELVRVDDQGYQVILHTRMGGG